VTHYNYGMNILITGVAGFVGTNLARKFLKDKCNVVYGIDNMLTGRRTHIEMLNQSPNFHFLPLDCRDLIELRKAKLPRIDILFHLAANSDIAAALINPAIDFDLGIATTHAMLEFSREQEVRHFAFSSGSGVYGEKPEEVFTEKSFVGKPTSTYGATKLASEALISAYSFMFDFKATVFRFSNLIGPFQTHGVIYDFMSKLKSNPNRLEILGDGTQLKPYIHISDAINGIMLSIENQTNLYEVFNISNNTATSVRDIATMVIDTLKLTKVEIKFQESDRGWKADIPKYMMSSDKLAKQGWKLQYNSDAAVLEAIKENLTATN
jgi:UDP-glucose 4-epimerase